MSEKAMLREPVAGQVRRTRKPRVTLIWTLVLTSLTLFVVAGIIQAAPMAPPVVSLGFLTPSPLYVAPGEYVLYTVRLRNTATPVANGTLTVTLPSQLDASTISATNTPFPPAIDGHTVVWGVSSIGSTYVDYTVTARVLTGTVLFDPLVTTANCYLSNSDGSGTASATTNSAHAIAGPEFLKALVSSVDTPANGELEAAAGEVVTMTSVITIPDGGMVYSAHPYVFLQDGLMASFSDPAWVTVEVGTRNELGGFVATNGTLATFDSFDIITGPETLTYTMVATRTSNLFATTNKNLIGNNVTLRFQPILRWCDYVGCTEWITTTVYWDEDYASAPHVLANRPDIDPAITYEYLDSAGVGAGSGPIRFVVSNLNTGWVSAYDGVLTATLPLSYTGATPIPDDVTIDGGISTIVWSLPEIEPNATWPVTISAQFPVTFDVGSELLVLSTEVYQESFEGDVPYEGHYDNGNDSLTLSPGLVHSKSSNYASLAHLRMGDLVTYTVVFTQGANTTLTSPGYTDTLPLGFHLAEPLSVEGATVVYSGVTSLGNGKEAVVWTMETLPVTSSPRIVEATYVVANTGLNTLGQHVYATMADMRSIIEVENSALLYWLGDTPVTELSPVELALRIIQPYLGDIPNQNYFNTARIDPGDTEMEIGGTIQFRSRFRNTTNTTDGDAYEVRICDQLPTGIVLYTGLAPVYSPPAACSDSTIIEAPSSGDNLVCWTINKVCRVTSDYTIAYYANIQEAANPGVPLANYVFIDDYTSLPGDVATERHYGEILAALPTPAECGTPGCLVVRGLGVSKTAAQVDVAPGDLLTYTIRYSDTTTTANYTNVVITDTYDASMVTFVSSDPAPDSSSSGELVWEIGSLADTSGQITLTMRVAPTIPDGTVGIDNTVLWDSDTTSLHSFDYTVPIRSANLNVVMTGAASAHAGSTVDYTVIYSNTGSAPAPITLTLDYGPYMDYVSASETPLAGTDNIFVIPDVPNTGAPFALDVQLQVHDQLPYNLAGPLVVSVFAESPGALGKSAQFETLLDRPVLNLRKIGPDVAPGQDAVMLFEIYVANTGTYTATNLVFTDTWGSHLDYHPANHQSHGWTEGPGTYVTRELPELGIGEEVGPIYFQGTVADVVIFYTNTVSLSSDQTTKQSVTEYVWQASIETNKTANPDPAFPGRVLTYTIGYTNTGGAVLNALITDTLPSGFVYQGHSETGGSGCSPAWAFTAPSAGDGGDAVWMCEGLAQEAVGQLQIWGEVMTTTEGTDLVNVTTSDGDGIPAREIFEPLVTRSARPWLLVDKSVTPVGAAAPGNVLTYTLTYENNGTDPAYDVVIVDQLPSQVESPVCGGGDACSVAGSVVTWNLDEIGVGEIGSVFVVVQVRAGVVGQTAINSNFSIRSDRLPSAETISGPAISTPILNPHLTLAKAAEPILLQTENGIITYTITYMNDGGGALTGVVITDAIDPRTAVVATSPSECVATGSAPNEVVTCDLGTVIQDETGVLEIYAQVVSADDGDTIPNVATGISDQTTLVESPSVEVVYVTGGCIPPVGLNFATTPHPRVGRTTWFTASVAYGDEPINYTWLSSGEGPNGSGAVISYTYSVSGTYNVTLLARNACNQAGVTKARSISVWDLSEIGVSPSSFSVSAALGATETFTDTLTISNSGTWLLEWGMEVMPSSATWLSVAVGAGTPATSLSDQTTPIDGSASVTLHFDPTGLALGSHEATLEIATNDPDHPTVTVPVTLVIGEQYDIYLPLVLRN